MSRLERAAHARDRIVALVDRLEEEDTNVGPMLRAEVGTFSFFV